jgi:glycerol-1-phosphate dehydrogenase [NAD(P)+]
MPAPLPEIVIAEDALERLLAGLDGPALVVMDPATQAAAGAALCGALAEAGITGEALVLESGQHPTDAAVAGVRRRLPPQGSPIAVGSGAITDIVRLAAHLSERDFISFPTAASMDGYASGVAVLERENVKVTLPARAPRAIYCDPAVVAAAPSELTRAGIGDLLAKTTARVDWLAAHLLLGEPFDEPIANRVLTALERVVADLDALLAGGVEAAASLMDGLIETGIAMAQAGSSRPASGCEHQASHFWDLLAGRGRRAPTRHGLQVGHATRFAMRLQRYAFGGGVEELRPPRPVAEPLDAAAQRWLGEPTREMRDAVAEKRRLSQAAAGRWPAPAAWAEIRARLAPELERFSAVERGLDRARIAIEVDPEMLAATFRYSSRLRARYTVVDFLEGQGALEAAIESMLAG